LRLNRADILLLANAVPGREGFFNLFAIAWKRARYERNLSAVGSLSILQNVSIPDALFSVRESPIYEAPQKHDYLPVLQGVFTPTEKGNGSKSFRQFCVKICPYICG
jgi:hypothetical protein